MSNTLFVRGTTPSIEVTVKTQSSSLDLHTITQIWLCISQQYGKIKVEKDMTNVVDIDYDHNKIFFKLTQEDTLNLKAGDATIQIRILLQDGTALATVGETIEIADTNKEGVITPGA